VLAGTRAPVTARLNPASVDTSQPSTLFCFENLQALSSALLFAFLRFCHTLYLCVLWSGHGCAGCTHRLVHYLLHAPLRLAWPLTAAGVLHSLRALQPKPVPAPSKKLKPIFWDAIPLAKLKVRGVIMPCVAQTFYEFPVGLALDVDRGPRRFMM